MFKEWLKQQVAISEALKAFVGPTKDNISNFQQLLQFNIPFAVSGNGQTVDISLSKAGLPNSIGGVFVNPKDKTITVDQNFEYDPYEVWMIELLYKTNLFGDFTINGTPIEQIVSQIKPVTGNYETWANPKYDFRSSIKPFAIKVIKEIHERNFYHATFKRYMREIKLNGIRPSKTFDDVYEDLVRQGLVKDGEGVPLGLIPQHGWSSFNPEKQRAVYFYLDPQKAHSLAKYLAYRNQEPTIVLEINGNALSDTSKLVVDEDALRDEGGASKRLRSNIPHFYYSALSHLTSIAYKGTIPPDYIKIIKEYLPEKQDEDEGYF